MLYLDINRRCYNLPHYQIFLSEHIRRRDRPWVDDSVLDTKNPSFYVCNPTIIDPEKAPTGHITLFVLVSILNRSHHIDWATKRKMYRGLIVIRMSLLEYENVEQHIVAEHCYTADTWRDEYIVHLGAVFNLTHGWSQFDPLRPPI